MKDIIFTTSSRSVVGMMRTILSLAFLLTLPTPAVARCYIPVSVPHFKKADFARSQAETVCPPVHSIQLEPVAISPGWQVQRTWGHRRWRGTIGLRPGVRVPRHTVRERWVRHW